jgi:ABC-type Mn2+/Zn2+ transport system permease subunit
VNWFEPFQEEFMQAAMLSGCLIAVMCALLSCFLILRGWSLMGDAERQRLMDEVLPERESRLAG